MYVAPGPFQQKHWTDAAGITWKVRRTGRGRLINVIGDATYPCASSTDGLRRAER